MPDVSGQKVIGGLAQSILCDDRKAPVDDTVCIHSADAESYTAKLQAVQYLKLRLIPSLSNFHASRCNFHQYFCCFFLILTMQTFLQ